MGSYTAHLAWPTVNQPNSEDRIPSRKSLLDDSVADARKVTGRQRNMWKLLSENCFHGLLGQNSFCKARVILSCSLKAPSWCFIPLQN